MKLDIVLQNGHVIDPYNQIDGIKTIGIKDGVITEVAEDYEAEQIIDASGCYVVPGLIDFHAHLYPYGTELGCFPDPIYLPTGVTTAVDAGSAGVANFPIFSRYTISSSLVNIKAYLYMCSGGQVTMSYHENLEPKNYNVAKIGRMLQQYSDEILGLKIRMGAEVVGQGNLEPLIETLKIAEKYNAQLVVHTTNPPVEISDMAALLRSGDVFAHVFQGKNNTIIDSKNKVKQAIKDARDRGVLFDAANGRNHFSFKVADAALEDGFLPDIISTDIISLTMYKHPVFSLQYIMSKYYNMGVLLHDIIRMTTQNPAKAMRQDKELGSLSEGTIADICIFQITDHPIEFADFEGKTLAGNKILTNQLTIKSGQVLYRNITF